MPRFDFKCQTCARVFEESLPFGSRKLPPCPGCGSRSVEKLITPPGIVFKGSGWYKTDSRTSAAPKKPEKKPDAPTEKPAATTEKKEMKKKD